MGIVLIANNLVNKSFKENISYNLIIILIYSLLNCSIFIGNQNPFQLILSVLIMSLSIKYIYDFSIVSSIILSIITILFLILSKLILSLAYINHKQIVEENWWILFGVNIVTITIAYLLSKIKFLQSIIKSIVVRFENLVIKGELILIILTISMISYLNYQVFSNRYLGTYNIFFMLFVFVLIVFSLIYIWNKNRYKELKDNYDNLFEYTCIYEEDVEKDELLKHEYKNQLAVIKGLTKSKKVLNHIDKILENNKEKDIINIKGLNNLPKGGLRGLFYYKISDIRKKNINFSIDISRSVKKILSQLKIEEINTLTYILGIFCDNAIDECKKDKNATISIEVYKIEHDISIVISNTIIDKVDLKQVGVKGYSTKGQNRGNGLYLIKKLLKNEDKISLSTKVINNYFVQELRIRTI